MATGHVRIQVAYGNIPHVARGEAFLRGRFLLMEVLAVICGRPAKLEARKISSDGGPCSYLRVPREIGSPEMQNGAVIREPGKISFVGGVCGNLLVLCGFGYLRR